MKLTVLGYLGVYPYKGEGVSSYLLESGGFHLLIDAGGTTLMRLENYLDPLKLDTAILSRYHHDHIADLDALQYYRQLYPMLEPTSILPIYSHTQDQMHFKKLTLPSVSEGKRCLETEELVIEPFLVAFMGTIHPVTYHAIRIVEKAIDKVLVFTGDLGYLASSEDFARGANLSLADTYLFGGNGRHYAHFTSRETGEIAKVMQVKQLMLAHSPQHGPLEQLREETQNYAGAETPVALAQPDLTVET